MKWSSTGMLATLSLVFLLHATGTGAHGRKLLACDPQAIAQSAVDRAVAEALAETVAAAFTSVLTCADAENFGADSTKLSVALSIAISNGADEITEACADDEVGDANEEAAQAVKRTVLNIFEETTDQEVGEEAKPVVAARSAALGDALTTSIAEARTSFAPDETPAQKAEKVANQIIGAVKNILSDLKCGADGNQGDGSQGGGGRPDVGGEGPTTPGSAGSDDECFFINGVYVGKCAGRQSTPQPQETQRSTGNP